MFWASKGKSCRPETTITAENATLGITCGRGSFAVHFGDHLRSRDHLRLGIICGTVQGSLAVLYSTPLYYSTYVFPYFEMWYNDTKPSTFKVFSLTWPVSMQDKVIETTTTTKKTFTCRKSSTLTAFVWNTNMAAARYVKPLSSAEAPARYPYKNSNNQKK